MKLFGQLSVCLMRYWNSLKLNEKVKRGEKAEGIKFIEGSTAKEKDDMKGHWVHDVKFAKN